MTLGTIIVTTTVAQYYMTKEKVTKKTTQRPAVKFKDVKDQWISLPKPKKRENEEVNEPKCSTLVLDKINNMWLDNPQDEEVQNSITLDMISFNDCHKCHLWGAHINLESPLIIEMLCNSQYMSASKKAKTTATKIMVNEESDWGLESEDEGVGRLALARVDSCM
jgi:hypothetical protein